MAAECLSRGFEGMRVGREILSEESIIQPQRRHTRTLKTHHCHERAARTPADRERKRMDKKYCCVLMYASVKYHTHTTEARPEILMLEPNWFCSL
jgi:hypothetical protein